MTAFFPFKFLCQIFVKNDFGRRILTDFSKTIRRISDQKSSFESPLNPLSVDVNIIFLALNLGILEWFSFACFERLLLKK